MNAPVIYTPDFVRHPVLAFERLWSELNWERRDNTPRREYYANDVDVPYTYGTGRGVRTYHPQKWHSTMRLIQFELEELTDTRFEVCFLNGYIDGTDQLGWHADDSPEMDDARPIAIVSLGQERDIMFRSNHGPLDTLPERLRLQDGSLCLMAPGMQDTHQHRIPRAGFTPCGPRLSLTFRGYAK